MTRKQARLLFLLTGVSLTVSVYALYVKKSEHKALNDTYELIRKFVTDYEFAHIVEHYDENPGEDT